VVKGLKLSTFKLFAVAATLLTEDWTLSHPESQKILIFIASISLLIGGGGRGEICQLLLSCSSADKNWERCLKMSPSNDRSTTVSDAYLYFMKNTADGRYSCNGIQTVLLKR
jgi:hypothetical protein